MSSVTRYQQYAADCLQQAQSEDTPDHKTIVHNVALAWLRLARQVEAGPQDESPPTVPGAEQAELTS